MLSEKFCRFIQDHDLPRTWIVGFSGGVDSTALLDLCLAQARERGTTVVAAHLHHGLRGREADADQEACGRWCAAAGVECVSERVDVRARARETGEGLEEAGRHARHVLFARLARARAPAVVMLAHHADDQLETVLMRLLRGGGLRGLAGMRHDVRLQVPGEGVVRVCRPLLQVDKEAIVAYARGRALSWREDTSNRDPGFLRNRVRLQLLPLLGELHPGARQNLLALARSARALVNARENAAARRYAQVCEQVAGGARIRLDRLRGSDELFEFARLVLARVFGVHGLRASVYRNLRNLAAGGNGRGFALPAGVRAWREPAAIVLQRPQPGAGGEGSAVGRVRLPSGGGTCAWNGWRLSVSVRAVDGPASIPAADRENPRVEWFACEALGGEIFCRGRRPGDRLRPLGAPGTRKVKKILADCKVPRRERERLPVLADEEGVLWLCPLCVGERTRLRAGTRRALRVEVTPSDR